MRKRILSSLLLCLLCVSMLAGCNFIPAINTQSNSEPAPVSNTETKKKILIVSFIDDKDEDVSDKTQVKNALSNGGMIVVYKKFEGYEAAFGDNFKAYAACDAEGSSYTFGAVLNYIASEGWSLAQAPSTEYNSYYYFQK